MITIAYVLSSVLTYVVEKKETICVWTHIQCQYHLWLLDCIAFIQSVVPFLNLEPVQFISQINVSYFSLCREFGVKTLYSLKIPLPGIAASLECPHTVIWKPKKFL